MLQSQVIGNLGADAAVEKKTMRTDSMCVSVWHIRSLARIIMGR